VILKPELYSILVDWKKKIAYPKIFFARKNLLGGYAI